MQLIAKYLEENQETLITGFDIHRTIKHITELPGPPTSLAIVSSLQSPLSPLSLASSPLVSLVPSPESLVPSPESPLTHEFQ